MKSVRYVLLTLSCLAAGAVLLPTSHANSAKPAAITFGKDIAPIFFKSCAECHRPG